VQWQTSGSGSEQSECGGVGKGGGVAVDWRRLVVARLRVLAVQWWLVGGGG
jgi:hypothetical protein